MNRLKKAWYIATAYVPRKLPTDEISYQAMLDVLVEAYGVVPSINTFATIAGHITSTPAIQLRRPWGHIANAAKRLKVNEFANAQRKHALDSLNKQLEEAVAKEVTAAENIGGTVTEISSTQAI